MTSGIYCIENKSNDKKYIGQTINLKRRINDHKLLLNKNRHHNIYLQREFNKFGKSNFEIHIVEECQVDELDNRERYWIECYSTLNNQNGYNMESGGNLGKIVSEATRLKKTGKNNPMYGKKFSEAHLMAIAISNRGNNSIIDEDTAFDIKEDLSKGMKRNDVAAKYNVNVNLIDKIISLSNWSYVHEDINHLIINRSTTARKIRDEKARELLSKGYSYAKISRELGIDPMTTSRILGGKADVYKVKKEQALEMFSKGMTTREIADELMVDYTTILRWTKP